MKDRDYRIAVGIGDDSNKVNGTVTLSLQDFCSKVQIFTSDLIDTKPGAPADLEGKALLVVGVTPEYYATADGRQIPHDLAMYNLGPGPKYPVYSNNAEYEFVMRLDASWFRENLGQKKLHSFMYLVKANHLSVPRTVDGSIRGD